MDTFKTLVLLGGLTAAIGLGAWLVSLRPTHHPNFTCSLKGEVDETNVRN